MIKYLHFILLIFLTVSIYSQNTSTINSIDKVTAYPNPFSVESKIDFNSNIPQIVIFEIKNILGKSMFRKTIFATIGKNTFIFHKNHLASGMYIYSLQSKTDIISKRLVIK